MKNIGQFAFVVALGSMMLAGSAVAQSSIPAPATEAGPGVHVPNHPRVNQVNRREAKQQRRIANGINNGSLTPGETARLEKGEARLERREQKDLAKNNGHLTKKEQVQLNRQENRMSKKIYRAKHNAKHN